MNKELDAAVKQLLAAAQATFTTSDEPADVKQSTAALRALLDEWRAHDKRVESIIGGLIGLICSRCKHVGAATGHNERDGWWMAPCPTCGETR